MYIVAEIGTSHEGSLDKAKNLVEKAKFAAAIGCKVLIPHHHDFRGFDDPEIVKAFKDEFLRLVPDGVFVTPEHGKWIHL